MKLEDFKSEMFVKFKERYDYSQVEKDKYDKDEPVTIRSTIHGI